MKRKYHNVLHWCAWYSKDLNTEITLKKYFDLITYSGINAVLIPKNIQKLS